MNDAGKCDDGTSDDGILTDSSRKATVFPSQSSKETNITSPSGKSIWGDEPRDDKNTAAQNIPLPLSRNQTKVFKASETTGIQPNVRAAGSIKCSFTPKGDFQGVFDKSSYSRDDWASNYKIEGSPGGKKRNFVSSTIPNFEDLPTYISDRPSISIKIKANKEKHKLNVNTHWSGEDALKIISFTTHIPLERMKLITKGQIVSAKSFWSFAEEKSLFQAIGEKAEDEKGVLSSDVDLIMKQMSVERNQAVKALRQSSGNVVDAIINLGNK